jgi:hypothetical protein
MLGATLGIALIIPLGAALELGESLGATLGEGLGAAVGPKPKAQVSSCVIVASMRSTRVFVRTLPTREEPASISTFVAPKIMPCIDAFSKILVDVLTRQKMFLACAQPARSTRVFAFWVSAVSICMTKTSLGPPSKVISEAMVRADVKK